MCPRHMAQIIFFRLGVQCKRPYLHAHNCSIQMLRREIDVILKRLVEFCGLNTKVLKGHSFRIGAATSAALRGVSDAQVRAVGRWASDAFRKYIRIAATAVGTGILRIAGNLLL